MTAVRWMSLFKSPADCILIRHDNQHCDLVTAASVISGQYGCTLRPLGGVAGDNVISDCSRRVLLNFIDIEKLTICECYTLIGR